MPTDNLVPTADGEGHSLPFEVSSGLDLNVRRGIVAFLRSSDRCLGRVDRALGPRGSLDAIAVFAGLVAVLQLKTDLVHGICAVPSDIRRKSHIWMKSVSGTNTPLCLDLED